MLSVVLLGCCWNSAIVGIVWGDGVSVAATVGWVISVAGVDSLSVVLGYDWQSNCSSSFFFNWLLTLKEQ